MINLHDFEQRYGPSEKEIPSIKIGDLPPTLKGYRFRDADKYVSVHLDDEDEVAFIHVSKIR